LWHAFVLVFVLAGSVFADAETQTEWSGGPGVAGPVTDWQDTFYVAEGMDWDTTPGRIKLELDRSENQIVFAYGPCNVISCDVDLDGDQDIVCSAGSGEIFWSENVNGEGMEWIKHTFAVLQNPGSVASADFDNNGFQDIAISCTGTNQIILIPCSAEGWGNGTPVTNDLIASQITAVDIDHDGLTDIAGVSGFSDDVCWLKNNGTGTRWNKIYIDSAMVGADACDAGDFNNDGYPDVAVSSRSGNTVTAYISQEPYGYSWNKYTIDAAYNDPVSIAVADYNNDGSEDFAIASFSGNGNLRWYDFLDTQSSWVLHGMMGAEAENIHDIVAHDMDGDGFPEVMAASITDNRITWFKNREYLGDNWRTFSASDYFGGAQGVAVGDMDGDNADDVLGCSSTGNMVSWWRVSGFTTPGTVTSSILNIESVYPDYVSWNYIHWSEATPSGTGIKFRLKTSYDSGDMGSWSTWINTPRGLGSLVSQGGQYLQYQAELYTDNPNATPSLKDISILWGYGSQGTANDGSIPLDGRRIWLTSGNPAAGAFSVDYNVKQAGYVSITVYDTSGRTVYVINEGELAAGQYSGIVSNLPAGSYAVVMQCAEGMAAQRVVVVR